MFQTFESSADPAQGRDHVARLREHMAGAGLDGFLVPRADEHQGEDVAAGSERLQWLTGFTGSAGAALVMKETAIIFVDGRYTLQARQQVAPDVFTIENLIDNPPARWLESNAASGWRIGFDPWLHTIADARTLRNALQKQGGELVPVASNLVDDIWHDRPPAPSGAISIQAEALAGESAEDKLARLAASVDKAGAAFTVLTDPSSLAWAFNIRGSDIAHTPVPLGFAVIGADGDQAVYLDSNKLGDDARARLEALARLRPPHALLDDVAEHAQGGASIALDPALAAERLKITVEEAGGAVVEKPDPARLPRATKNRAELDGARAAHRRDGAAVCRFLCWLDRQEPGSVDEITAVQQLERCRRAIGDETQMPLCDISFDTISGAGPNGAIIHYRVNRKSNRTLRPGELYLVDSGGQYRDGTTDITRTVPVGEPTREMRERYTLVLKGLIGLSMLRFPEGTRGREIDAIARLALWRAGLDYTHGTGHGVGSFLSVHEGPQRISKAGSEKLLTGMILSNEPGYYREGAYGIRLENLIVVAPPQQVPGGDLAMHGFETLTLAPFDRRLVDVSLLQTDERDWLDAYHARVFAEIGPMLDGETLAWLEQAAAPLPA